MLNRRRIAALLFAIATAAAISLTSAQASYADGAFVVRNPASGNLGCIQSPGFGKDVQLTTAPCDFGQLQLWILDPLGNNRYHIRNLATDFCMRALSNKDFSAVDTIDCTGISNEVWLILPSASGVFQIRSEISTGGEPCLDVQGGSSTTQTKPIDVFHCTSNNQAQLFTD